ncbi:UTRA domain-containing protein [Actinotalea sp. BY-33]|uniref:UTRA domain-containing protein n=1 Tax=Actinotalea soli TaxID=2819234 RepID=A0A939LQM8_9CELL|nr:MULTISPECIES: UTRA domain-containing protein [Actinotalea]MBO1752937.1 UTRA domain-containing protein [Actinotalea soli]
MRGVIDATGRPVDVELDQGRVDAVDEILARSAALRGRSYIERLLGTSIEDSPVVRRDLQRPRARLRRLETLIEIGDEPWVVSTYWVVDRDFPDLAEGWERGQTLVGAMAAGADLGLEYGWRSFSAAQACPEDAGLLQIPTGDPVLVRDGVNVDRDGRPVVRVHRRCRADRARWVLRYR